MIDCSIKTNGCRLVLNLGILVAAFVTLFTWIIADNPYQYIFILPFLFLISLLFTYTRELISRFTCIKLYYLILFISYVCLPILLCFTGYIFLSGREPSDQAINTAIWLLAYTRLVMIFYTEMRAKKILFSGNELKQKYINNYIIPPKNTIALFTFILTAIVCVGIFNGNYYSDYRWFWESTTRFYSMEENTSMEILFRFPAMLLHTMLPMIIIYFTKDSFDRNIISRILVYLICSIIICFVRGDNRLMIVVLCLSTLCYLNLVHPRYRIINNIIITFIATMILFIITIVKSFANVDGVDLYSVVRLLQLYIPSPRDIALSVDLSNNTSFAIKMISIVKDYITPINIIGKLGTYIPGEMSNNLYNLYVSNNLLYGEAYGQIMMMIGQGYFHFGFLLAPIYELIAVSIMLKCDTAIFGTNNDGMFNYSLLYVGFLTAFSPCLSLSGYIQTLTWGGGALMLIIYSFYKINIKIGVA